MSTTPELLKRIDAEIEIRAEVVRNHQFRARKEGKTTDRRLLQLLTDCRDVLNPPAPENSCMKCQMPCGTDRFCSGYCQETYHGLR